jgi:hypothetical protein
MTRRRTRCFTWGESRRMGAWVLFPGTGSAHVSSVEYHTACGKWVTDADDPPDDITGSRPPVVCPRCWGAR